MGGIVSPPPPPTTVSVINSVTSLVGLITQGVNMYFDVMMKELQYQTYRDRNSYFEITGKDLIENIKEASGLEELEENPTPENFVKRVNSAVRGVKMNISMYPQAGQELYDFKKGLLDTLNDIIVSEDLNLEQKSNGDYVLVAKDDLGKEIEITEASIIVTNYNNSIWYIVAGSSIIATSIAVYLAIKKE